MEYSLSKAGLKKGNCRIKHGNLGGPWSQCVKGSVVHCETAVFAALGFVLILAALQCVRTYIMPKMPASCATLAI